MKKRIITTVLTLCFVALALAGVASAIEDRDIGNFDYAQVNGSSTRTFTHERTKKYYSRQKAVINTDNFTLNTITSTGDHLCESRNERSVATTYYISWRVLDDGALVTEYQSVHNNQRKINPYTTTVENGTHFKLRVHNSNSFALTINGSWCPDCKVTD